MAPSIKPGIEQSFEQAYSAGYAYHKDLQLDVGKFIVHLLSVVEKYLGPNAAAPAIVNFINNLHTNDLYLAVSCAQHVEAAWDRFYKSYQKYVNDLALSVSQTSDTARELAVNVLEDLFLTDRSGRSRIASYEGRSSLAAWLHVIVSHRAINDRELKHNRLEPLEYICEIADTASLRDIEAVVRASRYEGMIKNSLKCACSRLDFRERLVLLFRYDQELQVSQIARLLGVSPSTISRQLERSLKKLRECVKSTLASKYRLEQEAIEECFLELRENPSHSIITFIKQDRE
jgi:RNA polymerase sigma-70 factor